MNVVLNFGRRHDSGHGHDRSDRVYLIWPAAAWRVVAPLPSDRHLNILQRAVLGILRGASRSADEIANKLHLHPRLVEAIGSELVSFGWVDQTTWRPSAKGLAMLEEEDLATDAIVSGWVFQDPWTGDLWPFFARQLQLQEAVAGSEPRRRDLVFDTAKGARRTQAWEPGAPEAPGQPTPGAILEAVRRFRRRERLKGALRFSDPDFDQPVDDPQSSLLSRITFVSDQPEPVGLVTYAHCPRNGALTPQICDPFGFGTAASMWGQLQRMAQQDEAASGAVRELLWHANLSDVSAFEDQLRRRRQSAEEFIVERLSLDIREYTAVFDHLVAVQEQLILADAVGSDPQSMLTPGIASCRKTFEALLKEVARLSPLQGVEQILTGDAKQDQSIVQNIAAAMGFLIPLPRRLVDSIQGRGGANDTQRRIKEIAKNLRNVYSIQAAVVATILASSRDVDHPLRAAAKRSPDLFSIIDCIQESGNPAAHDNSHESKPKRFCLSEAEHIRDLTLEVVACLLNLPLRKV
jgi:hypothetical protein